MRHAILGLMLLTLTGCSNGCNKHTDPLGPSSSAPQPTAGPTSSSWTTLYANAMDDSTQVADYHVHLQDTSASMPLAYSPGQHSGAAYGYYPPNGLSLPKAYSHGLPAMSGTKIEVTHWVYGISTNAGIGVYYNGMSAGYRMQSNAGTWTILYWDNNASALVPVVTASSTTKDVWRELKFVLDVSANTADYYVNGALIASAVPQVNNYFQGWGDAFASVLEYTSSTSSAISVDDILVRVQ